MLKAEFTPAPVVKGVYMISDLTTGKAYIGATNDRANRFICHKADLKNNRHHNRQLQQAENNGNELVVAFVEVPENIDPFDIERELINEFKPSGLLYNESAGMGQRKHSFESIEKMRLAKLGKTLSEEHRTKISNSCKGVNVGIKRTPEQLSRYKECRLEQARSVMVDGIEYESVNAAALAHDINSGTASSRFKSQTDKFKNWQYVDGK